MDFAQFGTYAGLVIGSDSSGGWGASQAQLSALESEIGVVLPDDLRDFLGGVAGADVPYGLRLPPDDPEGEFFALGWIPDLDRLVLEVRSYPDTVMAEVLGPEMLPVADLSGGSLFVSIGRETFGEVWAFTWALPSWTGRERQSSAGIVARSWTEFLQMLTVEEEWAEELWSLALARPEDVDWRDKLVVWLDSRLSDWRSRPWAVDAPPG